MRATIVDVGGRHEPRPPTPAARDPSPAGPRPRCVPFLASLDLARPVGVAGIPLPVGADRSPRRRGTVAARAGFIGRLELNCYREVPEKWSLGRVVRKL